MPHFKMQTELFTFWAQNMDFLCHFMHGCTFVRHPYVFGHQHKTLESLKYTAADLFSPLLVSLTATAGRCAPILVHLYIGIPHLLLIDIQLKSSPSSPFQKLPVTLLLRLQAMFNTDEQNTKQK